MRKAVDDDGDVYIQFLLCTVQSLSNGSSVIDGFVLAISGFAES